MKRHWTGIAVGLAVFWVLLDPVLEITERHILQADIKISGGGISYVSIGRQPRSQAYGIFRKRHWGRYGALTVTATAQSADDCVDSVRLVPHESGDAAGQTVSPTSYSSKPNWDQNSESWQWKIVQPQTHLLAQDYNLLVTVQHCGQEQFEPRVLEAHLRFDKTTKFHFNTVTKLINAT